MDTTIASVTTKERLHRLVDALSEREADEALRIFAERSGRDDDPAAIGRAIAGGYSRIPPTPDEDAWALANAREAIREEPW
jgi:hypothetical protein